MRKYPIIVIGGGSLTSRKFDGSHPDVFSLGANNNNSNNNNNKVLH